MSRGPSPIVRRRRLGGELRRLREAAGLTGEQVIARVGWASASKLSRLENGRSRPDLAAVVDLLDLYGVSGREREELVAIARDAGNTRGWLRDYDTMTLRQRAWAELESGSVQIREYAPVIVPGLLQTEGYARARIMSSRALRETTVIDLDAEVRARAARQMILSRENDPPEYEVVLEEAALGVRAAPPDVMREQLAHLAGLAALPNVTIRVMPREATIADYYVPHGAFSLYRSADPDDPETLAVEALGGDEVVTDKALLTRYALVFEWLRQAALSPEQSLLWLTAAATPANGRSAPRPRRSESATTQADE